MCYNTKGERTERKFNAKARRHKDAGKKQKRTGEEAKERKDGKA